MKKRQTIHIQPGSNRVEVPQGQPLLEALMRGGFFLRNDCGGKGVCGKCRVDVLSQAGEPASVEACQVKVDRDMTVRIPQSALSSPHIMDKAGLNLPETFASKMKHKESGPPWAAAVDLGTTTIAVYLCSLPGRKVIASLALKNPQFLYGADVMSRISAIGKDPGTLGRLQDLTIKGIQWGLDQLLSSKESHRREISKMVVVGNPTMIHILTGTDPSSIGTAPYLPQFFDPRQTDSGELGFQGKGFQVHTLPNVAGFLGGDILAAALASELEHQPDGTLLVDLGTNGELLLKQGGRIFGTSCATGPSFEGATLSCGIQAIPGAVNGVTISPQKEITHISRVDFGKVVSGPSPGICGAGVINAVAQMVSRGIVQASGKFAFEGDRFTLIEENSPAGQAPVYISQKDIRSVQLGKSALFTGIEFLLREAGLERPEKLILAGAFGSYMSKSDLICLGMIPAMDHDRIDIAGNLAGSGAVMAVCEPAYGAKATQLAKKIETVELALDTKFQQAFVGNLGFPV